MIAFACVAIREDGHILSEYEAVLRPFDGATTDSGTMGWWKQHPEAFAAATTNPEPPGQVMARFVDWVKSLPQAIFTAHSLAFDGIWMDFYLRRYTPYAVLQGHYETDRLSATTGLCPRSFASAITGKSVAECDVSHYPIGWLGNHTHTHRAIDDARSHGSLLILLLAISKARSAAQIN